MFTDEHAPDYSFPPRFDVYPDDFLEIESDADNFNDDLFDSKGEKIKEAELLIDQLDLPCDILPYLEGQKCTTQKLTKDGGLTRIVLNDDSLETYVSYSDVFCRFALFSPQDDHHHKDRPDLLGERQEFYMLFAEPKVSQTSSGEPAILLCLVAATEDHLSLRDTTNIVVQVQKLFVVVLDEHEEYV
nr:hypothetical protein [Tanacetum cinerariifolium]